MSEAPRWTEISVYYEKHPPVYLRRDDFKKMEQIKDVLDALYHAKQMKHKLDRLLGERDP